MYERFKHQVEFLLVYIREAHPTDGWAVDSGWSIIADARDIDERKAAAHQACEMLSFPFTVLIDEMDDRVAERWSAWPERLFVVSTEGRIVYVGEQGPWGFWPRADSEPFGWGMDEGFPHGEPLDRFLAEFLAEG